MNAQQPVEAKHPKRCAAFGIDRAYRAEAEAFAATRKAACDAQKQIWRNS